MLCSLSFSLSLGHRINLLFLSIARLLSVSEQFLRLDPVMSTKQIVQNSTQVPPPPGSSFGKPHTIIFSFDALLFSELSSSEYS